MNSKQEYLIKKLKEAIEHDEYSNAVSYYDTLKLYSYRSKRTYTFYNINSSFERKELP